MSALSRLGLGTAQFGMDYGISNRSGRPSESEVASILALAAKTGIGHLDTAPGYGEAEAIVGRCLPAGHALSIVTKLPQQQANMLDRMHYQAALDAVAASLEKLRQPHVHGVLVHNVADLEKPGWQHLVDALQEAKRRGLVERIGASIYDAGQLALVESRFAADLIQAPINLFDRRLVDDGTLDRLKRQGTEVHARSVFLQGALLMKPDELPEFLAPLRAPLAELQARCAAAGISVMSACLRSVLRHRGVDAAIVGVNSVRELEEIVAAVSSAEHADIDIVPPAEANDNVIDPRRWPASAR